MVVYEGQSIRICKALGELVCLNWKFNSSPLNISHPKRNIIFSNHHFSGVNSLLNFRGVASIQFIETTNAQERQLSTQDNPGSNGDEGYEGFSLKDSVLFLKKMLMSSRKWILHVVINRVTRGPYINGLNKWVTGVTDTYK